MNRWIVLAPVKGAGLPDRMPWKEEEWQRFSCGPAKAYVRRDGRFSGDQVFDADKKGILFADGVLLNLAELKAEYRTDSLPEIVRRSGAETNGVFLSGSSAPSAGVFMTRKETSCRHTAIRPGTRSCFTAAHGAAG